MSAFWIGQPVKKVRGGINVGATGTFVGWVDGTPFCAVRPNVDVVTTWGEIVRAGTPWPTKPEWWEPIIPDGLESIEEINALYEPEPSPVRA